MALDIQRLQREPYGGVYISPVRICLTADGQLVEETDPRAERLLVGAGGTLTLAEAGRYGLLCSPASQGAGRVGESPANKGRKRKEDKSAFENGEPPHSESAPVPAGDDPPGEASESVPPAVPFEDA